jgi:hypothetical protein
MRWRAGPLRPLLHLLSAPPRWRAGPRAPLPPTVANAPLRRYPSSSCALLLPLLLHIAESSCPLHPRN